MKRFIIRYYYQDSNLPDIINCYPHQSTWLNNITKDEAIVKASAEYVSKLNEANFYGVELMQVLKTQHKQITKFIKN